MNKEISISKDEINLLPPYKYQGEISLIETQDQAIEAIELLSKEPILGFDTETRAAFKKGESYDVSMLQLGTASHVYLFRLNKLPFSIELASILSNPDIVKTGVGIRDDIIALKKLLSFTESNFVDLADIAKEKNIKNFGLRALTAICLEKKLSKKSKISNWERQELTPAQINYAACDAAVGFQIYAKLCLNK